MSNGADWAEFAKGEALKTQRRPSEWNPVPEELAVDKGCPDCTIRLLQERGYGDAAIEDMLAKGVLPADIAAKAAERWIRVAIFGETPGTTGVHRAASPDSRCDCGRWASAHSPSEWGRMFPIPAQRAGVQMRCLACSGEFRYRKEPFTAEEQAARTAELNRQAKIGRMSL